VTTSENIAADAVREQVRAFLRGVLRENIGDDVDIFATGLANSLLAMRLVTFVETSFGLTVEAEDLDFANFRSIGDLTEFVHRKRAGFRGERR
jgi:methoxymalonate biosynthesis acyl carrier protein